MTLNHNFGCFSGVGSGIAGNVWQLGEGGTCRILKVRTNVRATFAKLLVVGSAVN